MIDHDRFSVPCLENETGLVFETVSTIGVKTQVIQNERKPNASGLAAAVQYRSPCGNTPNADTNQKEVNDMATIPKLIKAAVNFSKALPEQLLAQGYAVLKGLTGNANFTTLPVDLALLKSTLDAYSLAIGEARDGGKKAIAARNRLGEEVIRLLRGLATYVELNCKDDMNTVPVGFSRGRALARRRNRWISP